MYQYEKRHTHPPPEIIFVTVCFKKLFKSQNIFPTFANFVTQGKKTPEYTVLPACFKATPY